MLIRKAFILLIIFLSFSTLLFARGKTEAENLNIQNNEWLLCITNFDNSGLALERRAVSGVVMRNLVEQINSINYRAREDSEYDYYKETVWAERLSVAAKALESRQNERSLLLFRGEPDWRYRLTISNLDRDIERLKKELEEIEKNIPLINRQPVFNLTAGNLEFHFPDAPVSGNEFRFCSSQGYDALLLGSIADYHGRFLLNIKLYTVFARAFVWEDTIVFSAGDLDAALEEIMRRLIVLLSGSQPGAVAINVQPEDALVLINRTFAGRGETEILEFPPGPITVSVSSQNYESITFETDIAAGELSKISINLNPIEYGDLEITGNRKGVQGSVYLGAVYVGESPLTLRLPLNYMEYVEVETHDGETGRVIFQTPEAREYLGSIPINTAKPPRDGRVDRARRMFYWSFGATWVAGITAWISHYSYNSLAFAYNQNASHNERLYSDAQRMSNINNGAMIALGTLAVLDIILLVRYVYLANKGSTQVMQAGLR